MFGTSQVSKKELTETVQPNVGQTSQLAGSVLSEIARTLWPTNTAANIAALVGCSISAAERYLGGQREWSGDALAAIVQEIMHRHKIRNVRIRARP